MPYHHLDRTGISSDDVRDLWVNLRKGSMLIASPVEQRKKAFNPQLSTTREGVKEGVKAASIACIVAAVPTMAAVRFVPWAKANLNYTAQALIVSGASVAAFFIAADKTILERARSNARYDKST